HTALRRRVIDKRLLNRGQRLRRAQPFDRYDLRVLDLVHGENAGFLQGAIDQHRAGPANADIASVLGTGQPEVSPQDIQQRALGIHLQGHWIPIDRSLNKSCRGGYYSSHDSSAKLDSESSAGAPLRGVTRGAFLNRKASADAGAAALIRPPTRY